MEDPPLELKILPDCSLKLSNRRKAHMRCIDADVHLNFKLSDNTKLRVFLNILLLHKYDSSNNASAYFDNIA